MKEDEECYYVVNDMGNIVPYSKRNFNLVSCMAEIIETCFVTLPSNIRLKLEKGSIYNVYGECTLESQDNFQNMCIISLADNTTPIAIDRNLVTIVER
jgi:hypothetical protein